MEWSLCEEKDGDGNSTSNRVREKKVDRFERYVA